MNSVQNNSQAPHRNMSRLRVPPDAGGNIHSKIDTVAFPPVILCLWTQLRSSVFSAPVTGRSDCNLRFSQPTTHNFNVHNTHSEEKTSNEPIVSGFAFVASHGKVANLVDPNAEAKANQFFAGACRNELGQSQPTNENTPCHR